MGQQFLYTRSVPRPLAADTVKELRTILRLTQLAGSVAAFICLAISTVSVNYSYALLSFVSFSCLFLYFYPAFLGVPPHRHPRFSRIEVIVDLLYIGFWLSASSAMAFFGVSTCPRRFFQNPQAGADGGDSCLSWNMCFAFGYITALLFGATFVMGVRDLYLHGWFGSTSSNAAAASNTAFSGARGNWREKEAKPVKRKSTQQKSS
ncbi:MAG: hypothetical protein SGCHY_002735 [Lobulomycetales sp.]